MRRRLGISLLLAAVAVTGGIAHGEVFQSGTLRVTFSGDFAPRVLPRDRPAPVTVTVDGRIATTDGSHPPALRRFEVGLNRNGRLTTRGLPTCDSPELQSTTSAVALSRCRPALVGRGRFGADVALDQQALPVRGEILIFNARLRGRPGVLLHLHGTVPVQATFVLPLTIFRRDRGQFGTVLATKVPRLAGGLGSITRIRMRIGRTYSYRGQRLSFLSASCAAPEGFDLAIFPFARGSFSFASGRRLDIALTRNCRVR